MPLYCFNKTDTDQVLPVVSVTVGASESPPARGPAVNVTSELRGLSAANYQIIQRSVDDGTFDFEWVGTVEYETIGLTARRPSASARDAAGNDLGSLGFPFRTDPVGTTSQPVFARGELDTYLSCSGVVVLTPEVDSQTSVIALQKTVNAREVRLSSVTVHVSGNGPNHDGGGYRLDLVRLVESAEGESLLQVALGTNAAPPEASSLLPAKEVSGELLFSIPVSTSFTGDVVIDLGPFTKPLTFPADSEGGVALSAIVYKALQDEVRVSATLVWVER